MSLGTYPFAGGLAGTVELADSGDGYVVTDAVRFIRQ